MGLYATLIIKIIFFVLGAASRVTIATVPALSPQGQIGMVILFFY